MIADISDNRLAEEGLQMSASQQAALAQFGLDAVNAVDLQATMNRAVAMVAQTLRVEYANVLERLPDGRSLLLRAGVGWREGRVGYAIVEMGLDSEADYTLQNGEPVVVTDVRTERRFCLSPLLREHGVISGLSVAVRTAERRDGVLGVFTTSARTFTPEDANFLRAVANVLAKTIDRIRAEERNRQYVDRLASFINSMPTPVYALDTEGRVLLASRSLGELAGTDPSSLLGKTIPKILSDGGAGDALLPHDRQVLVSGLPAVFEETAFGRTFVSTKFPLRDAAGRIFGLGCVLADSAHDTRLAEEKLALSRLAECLAACIGIDEVLEVVREETARLFGWDAYYFAIRRTEDDAFRAIHLVDTVDGKRQVFPAEAWGAAEVGSSLQPLLAGEGVLFNRSGGGSQPPLDRFGDTSRCSASLMFAPVRAGSAVIGMLSAQSYTPQRYGPRDLDLLLSIADLVAPTLQRVYFTEAMHEAGRFAQSTLNALSAHIAIVNADGLIEAVNDAWRKFAAENGPIAGNVNEGANYFNVCDAAAAAGVEEAARFVRGAREVLAGQRERLEFEYACHSRDTRRWFSARVTRFAGQGPPRIVVAHEDITEKKQAFEERDCILNLSRDLICVAGADGYFKYVNPACEQVLGYSREELLSRPFLDFIHPDDHVMNDSEVARLLTGTPSIDYEDRYICRDGSVRIIEWTATPLSDKGLFYCVGRDVTERRKAEREAQARQEQLAHIARLNIMGELATGIAHELNQPLTAILAGAETLLRLIRSPTNVKEVEHLAKQVANQAERAGQIVRRLRTFVRRHEIQRSALNINEVIREAVRFVAQELQSHRIALRLQLVEPVPPIQGDAVQLEQVVLNLVRNAIDSMKAPAVCHRMLTIQTQCDDAKVEIAVQDTGQGLAPEARDRLFQPFFSTKTDGMGIGLSISRSLVEAHGGRIWAEPNSEGGLTLRFTLPIG